MGRPGDGREAGCDFLSMRLANRIFTSVCLRSLCWAALVVHGARATAAQAQTAAAYQPGQSLEALRQLEGRVRQAVSRPELRAQVEAELIQLLEPGATFDARRFACEQLGILGGKSALPQLARLLTDDASAGIACLAVTTYPPGAADEVLRKAMAGASGTARIQIINTLGDRRDRQAVKLISRLASDADPATATAAIVALGKIGDPASGKALSALRRQAQPELRTTVRQAELNCAEGLANAGQEKAARSMYEQLLAADEPAYLRRAAFSGLLRLPGERPEGRILAAMRGSDAALKPAAIAAIRVLPDGVSSERFVAELSRLEAEAQVWLIASLETRSDRSARAAVRDSVRSPEPTVRLAAIGALGRTGEASDVRVLVSALEQSKTAEEGQAIQNALIELGDATATAALGEAIQQALGKVRAQLLAVLARRQGAGANPVLLREAGSTDPTVAAAALRALGQTAGSDQLPGLALAMAEAANPDLRGEAANAIIQVLGRAEDHATCARMVRDALAQATSIEIRCAFLGLLPACGDAETLALLETAKADPDARVREAAVRALAEWPDIAAWDALLGLYAKPENELNRELALRGLVRLATEQNGISTTRQPLRYMQLLSHTKGDPDLKLILGALGGAAQPEALSLALPLLSNAGVRPEAKVAVQKIAEAVKSQFPEAAQEALRKLEASP